MDAPAWIRRSLLVGVAVLLLAPASAGAQDPSTRIIGGSGTTVEEWPWQVGVAFPPSVGGNGYDRQFCGGSLVSATAVLTAAHCAYDEGFVSPQELSVITGRTTLSSSAGAEIAVSDVIYFAEEGGVAVPQSQQVPTTRPQLYDEASSDWDVAVLELASPAPGPAAPIALADPAERAIWNPGEPVFATGWGEQTSFGAGDYPDDMREVELEVISDADCGDVFSYGGGFHPATMVCAGSPPLGGEDSCQGDSGGPLVAPFGGGYRLVGVTSFGEGCAVPEKWGVYARVADSTMRGAITAAIPRANGDPAPADSLAPETAISKRPRKGTTMRRARFAWSASETATFVCSLDRAEAKPCSSPFVKRVRAGRRHTFAITATDPSGNVEATPATYRWKVKRRR